MGRVEQLVPEGWLLAEIELETLILYGQMLRMRGKVSRARELLEKVSDYVWGSVLICLWVLMNGGKPHKMGILRE